ncbi:hypothetical protein E1A91_D09G241500v1 [Gossypium mustelinum]|uniref:Uncharacterized protein n=1 Tax=Gossypium mustelinum TaxID=34275 RepID=A0A5D2TR78_GOSMU|nr:hypothetical protein E1A91_D09G241500v1 [Gossypium mustelinum]
MNKRETNCEENDEEQWMENCYVVYSIYVYHVYCTQRHIDDVPGKFPKGKKRNANYMLERQLKKISDAIRDVAESIR